MITFPILICFSETTPESAEQGDFSDSGVVSEEDLTFTELVERIQSNGFYREGVTPWLSTGWNTSDYKTGTEREEALFLRVTGDKWTDNRNARWFDVAVRLVKARRKMWYDIITAELNHK